MTEYRYRWIRTEVRGFADKINVAKKIREGWEIVPENEHPPAIAFEDHFSGWRGPTTLDNLLGTHGEFGGLVLYRIPEESAAKRDAYYQDVAKQNLASIEAHYMREGYDSASKLIENGKALEYRPHPEGSELVRGLKEYYSEANRKEHPERQQEFEDSERRLQAKGLSFN